MTPPPPRESDPAIIAAIFLCSQDLYRIHPVRPEEPRRVRTGDGALPANLPKLLPLPPEGGGAPPKGASGTAAAPTQTVWTQHATLALPP